jgi:hypothetical protein
MTVPFEYPLGPHARRHGPHGYADYPSFQPWLRDEFSFRCVYCLIREQWGLVRSNFNIDHFRPTAHHPALVTDYDNLLYACATCNVAKGARVLPDPMTSLTAAVVRVEEDGTIHAEHNSEAARLIDLLGLDGRDYIEFRKLWIKIIAMAARVDQDPDLYRRLMGFPDDLPDLRLLRPPGGNSRPWGVEQSAFVRRERGELPSCY